MHWNIFTSTICHASSITPVYLVYCEGSVLKSFQSKIKFKTKTVCMLDTFVVGRYKPDDLKCTQTYACRPKCDMTFDNLQVSSTAVSENKAVLFQNWRKCKWWNACTTVYCLIDFKNCIVDIHTSPFIEMASCEHQ